MHVIKIQKFVLTLILLPRIMLFFKPEVLKNGKKFELRNSIKGVGVTLRKHAHAIYVAIFHGCKNGHFQMKNCDIFLIFAQNIDCGYTLEPPMF